MPKLIKFTYKICPIYTNLSYLYKYDIVFNSVYNVVANSSKISRAELLISHPPPYTTFLSSSQMRNTGVPLEAS